jgi:hypothetical protein
VKRSPSSDRDATLLQGFLIYAVRHDPPRGISSADLVVRKTKNFIEAVWKCAAASVFS